MKTTKPQAVQRADEALDALDLAPESDGVLWRVLRWAHLSGEAPTEVRRRIVAIALCAWLPLLLLSALHGQLLGGSVAVPFALDVEAHIRFLVALPLLVAAGSEVLRRVNPLLQAFLERALVPEDSIARFRAAVASAARLRNSVPAACALVALVYGVGVLTVWRHYLALDVATWYATPGAGGSKLTPAGIWYACVSLPIVQFLLLRWYWRLFAWARLLWQVSRIRLDLNPAHPDRCGGLGFLESAGLAFALLAAAHGALLAGQIASRILFAGAELMAFADQVIVIVVFMLCLVLAPLLFFTPQLAAAKRAGLHEYGSLAMRYVRGFDAKWLRGRTRLDEALVGSADIQSLADLGTAYEAVRSMRISPVSTRTVIALAAASIIAIAPLSLTMIPLNELLVKLLGIVF